MAQLPVRRRKYISFEVKLKIIEKSKSGASKCDIIREYGISRNQYYTIMRKEKEILSYNENFEFKKKKKNVSSPHQLVNELLLRWFMERRDMGIPVDGPILKAKALELNELHKGPESFKASNGWLRTFKVQNGIRLLRMEGEILSNNEDAAKDASSIPAEKIKSGGLNPENNADESGCEYKLRNMNRRQSLKRKSSALAFQPSETSESTDDQQSFSDVDSNMETDDSMVSKHQQVKLDETIEPTNAELLRLVRRIKGFEDLDEEDIERWNNADNYEPHAPLTDEEIIARVMERKKDKENEEKKEQRAKAAKGQVSQKGSKKGNDGMDLLLIKEENEVGESLSDQGGISTMGKGKVGQSKEIGDVHQWIKKEVDPLADQEVLSMAMRDQGQGLDDLGWIKQENDAEDPLSDHQIMSMAMNRAKETNDKQGNIHSSDDIFTPAEAKNAATRLIKFFEKQTELRPEVLMALRTLQAEVALMKI